MTEQRPTIEDAALEILRKTDDGDKLSPIDLKLLEAAVNGFVNEDGEAAFFAMLDRVRSGDALSSDTDDRTMTKHIRLTGAHCAFTACGRTVSAVRRDGDETAHFPYSRITRAQAEKLFTCSDCIAAWYDDEASE